MLNAGRAGSRPHSPLPEAQLNGFPRRQQQEQLICVTICRFCAFFIKISFTPQFWRKGNPNEKKEILMKKMWRKGNPIEKMWRKGNPNEKNVA